MNKHDISRREFLLAAGAAGACMGLAGCSSASQQEELDLSASADEEASTAANASLAEQAFSAMTMEEKIAQLFIVTPEQLTGYESVTQAGEVTEQALLQYPVGGLCYFAQNIEGAAQLEDMLSKTNGFCASAGAGIAPFLSVDEEGGTLVARVANSGYFDVEQFPDMAQIGASGDVSQASHVGQTIGAYLKQIGFNLDFAPVADVLTNPDNQVIGARSFGSDPQLVSSMVSAEVSAMLDAGMLPCVKHFPGHGDTEGDSHTGAVYATRTREEIESCEFLPFEAAIEAGCPLVMVGHIETPNFAADDLPASLSKTMISEVLRGELGFSGLVVSDSFSMGAITENFEAGDAAVRFLSAGGDVVLMPEDLSAAFQGVQEAVEGGALAQERIDESALRILQAKEAAGILV